MAGNLSDKGLSSDDEPGKRSFSVAKASATARTGPTLAQKDKELSSSSDEMPTEAQKVGRPSERTEGTGWSDSTTNKQSFHVLWFYGVSSAWLSLSPLGSDSEFTNDVETVEDVMSVLM